MAGATGVSISHMPMINSVSVGDLRMVAELLDGG
jgi:hypothetical protein